MAEPGGDRGFVGQDPNGELAHPGEPGRSLKFVWQAAWTAVHQFEGNRLQGFPGRELGRRHRLRHLPPPFQDRFRLDDAKRYIDAEGRVQKKVRSLFEYAMSFILFERHRHRNGLMRSELLPPEHREWRITRPRDACRGSA